MLLVGGDASPEDGAALEERREGDLVGHGERHEGGEAHVRAAVLDHAEVLGVEASQLGGLFLRQAAFFPELSEPKAEAALGAFDGLFQGRAEPHL